MGSQRSNWIIFSPLIVALAFTGILGYLIYFGFEAKERYTEQIVASHNIIDAASGLLLGFYYAESGEEIFPIFREEVPRQIETTIDIIEYYSYMLASSSQVKPHRKELVNSIIIPMVNFKKEDLRTLVLTNRPFAYEDFELNYDEQASEQIKSILTELIIREQADLFELSERIANDRLYINIVAMFGLFFIAITIGFAYFSLKNRTNENILLINELENKNHKLKELNSELINSKDKLEEFMSIAAHDLRGPLTSISSVTNIIQSENSSLPADNMEYLKYIREAVSRMTEMINYLLDGRNTGLNKRKRIVETSLSELINQIIFSHTDKASKKKIKIVFDNSLVGTPVKIDKIALSQILDNLISNAVKFSPHDKTIIVNAKAQGSNITISIKDEGPGFKQDELDHIFKPGMKFSAKPTGGEPSSGLGLYITKTQVDEINGSISLDTGTNGSTFKLQIPAQPVSE